MDQKQPEITIGIIGGSGIYNMDGVTDIEEIPVDTPFGQPSDAFMVGRLNQTRVVFLPRHGRNHHLLPSELNFCANIFGFKKLGATHLLSITAVGSLQEHIAPLDMVVPDQIVDRTRTRTNTFFGDGIVAHVSLADPFCPELSGLLYQTAASHGVRTHKGGTLVTIEGPSFSTRAESRLYRKWGIDIIGMTSVQEARLAREAQICYAALAMVTDYDCWKEDTEAVSVEAVLETFKQNVSAAKAIIKKVIPLIGQKRTCRCATSLKGAIMTPPDRIDEKTRHRLMPLIQSWLEESSKSKDSTST